MAEFINVEQTDSLNIIPVNSSVLSSPSQALSVQYDGPEDEENIYNIEKKEINLDTESEIPILIHNSCDVSKFYGDPNPDGSFKLDNLFSELVDDYQRAVARKNLGVADNQSLIWGVISGNILQQVDLVNWLSSALTQNNNVIIDDLNTVLNQWSLQLNESLDSKAPINSPKFVGIPEAPHPHISDSSKQIATTQWVNAKLNEGTFISSFYLDKSFMFVDEQDLTVTLFWEYNTSIEKQWINGIEVPINDRFYIKSQVNDSFNIVLNYQISGKVYSKSIFFEKVIPNFYGKSQTLQSLEKTKENNFTVDCSEEEYVYLYIPYKNNIRIAVDNIVGGFNHIGIANINSSLYYIYKSVYSGLGFLNITIL